MSATGSRTSAGFWPAVIAAAAAAALAACAGTATHAAQAKAEHIRCDGRHVEYSVAGGLVAPEAGIEIDCKDGAARVVSWRLEGNAGRRHAVSRPLTGAELDRAWQKVEDTGWRNLGDCKNPSAAKDDPVYTFDISAGDDHVSVSCQGKTLPFPYDRLVNQLDLLSGSLGD